MKKFLMMMVAVMAMSFSAQAKTVKTSFNVGGGCASMCKPRIEKAAKSVKGVLSASWNAETKQMKVVYDNKKTNEGKIMKAIAAVGHDTPKVKAPAAVYNKLPGCCQYRGAKRGAASCEHKM